MCTTRTGAVLCSLLLLSLLASIASADGMFVWRNRTQDIVEPTQKALILFDHGLEDLALEVRYAGAPREFGWIVPLPSRPRMRADDPELFTQLSMATQEAYAPRSERVDRRLRTAGVLRGGDVRVLERARVGIFDAAVIASGDGAALQRWLTANRFHPPRGGEAILGEYARRGWVFVALRITSAHADTATARALADGTVQPVRFRFATEEPVFPLRISAAGTRRATVLLYVAAREPLRHRTCDRAAWEEHACRPVPSWVWTLDPDSTYRGVTAGGQLTKLRTEVAADAMEDVYFRPFDPWPGLASPDERTRLESIRLLGEMRPAGAALRLHALLDSGARAQRESLAVLWALGRLGGDDAVSTLVRFASAGSVESRLEALESLARLRAPELLPVLARGMVAPGRDEYDHALSDACTELLVANGEPSVLGVLQELQRLPAPPPRRFPSFDDAPSVAERLMAARAACGDVIARDSIVQRIVSGSGVSSAESMERGDRRFGNGISNGFPMGFWLGLRLGAPFRHRTPWVAMDTWEWLLRPRAMLHDEVLRRVAAGPSMPPLGRILSLGLLIEPGDSDADTILALATRRLPGRTTPLVLEFRAGWSGERMTRYDVPRCMAAYAFGRMRAESHLLRLWVCSGDIEPDSREEIVTSLAYLHTSRSDSALFAYVTEEWQPRFDPARPKLEVASPSRGRKPLGPGGVDLGREGTISAITSALASESPDTTWMRRLTTDPGFSPRFRLFWMSQLPGYQSRWRPLVADLRRELMNMERSAVADTGLIHVISGIRAQLDRLDRTYETTDRPRESLTWR
jgi:hypothetical protein